MLDRPSQRTDLARAAAAAPLLLLPGTLCDARLFAPVLERMGLRATVPPLAGASSAAAMAQLILAAAPRHFSLAGFSLGAIVALEIIAQAPERVERLALIGSNPGVLPPAARASRAVLERTQFLAPQDPLLLHEMAIGTPPGAYRQQTAMTLSRVDSRPRLPRIAVPTLVLCGEADRTCPPAMSREIAAAIPQARLAIIAGAGHYVTLDRPDAVATELAAWLATPSPSAH